MKFRKTKLLISLYFLISLPTLSWGQSQNTFDDLLLFEAQLDQSILADGVTAFRKSHRIYLPLGELSNLLTLAITINHEQKTATGFIITEDRKFFLDTAKQKLMINGAESSYDSRLVFVQENEIFVESKLFESWFPIELTLDIPSLTLKISPKELLPIQTRILREKNQQTENNLSQPDYLNSDIPYAWIDKPFLDQTFEGSYLESENTPPIFVGRYTTQLTGDLLGLEAHLLASGSDQKNLENLRFTLGRVDPEGKLLGQAKARSFSMGHINMPSQLYTARASNTGQGAMISNRLLSRPTRFDTQDFKGDLLPGWDVELFHNGTLLGHQRANEKAQYEFNDVALLFGGNDFRLVFHGPVGQIREEHIRFQLEDSLVLPGETFYYLAAVQQDDGSTRTLAQIDTSLFAKMSANLGLVSDHFKNVNSASQDLSRSYYNFGLRSYFDPFFVSTDAISSSDGGRLGAVSMKTNFWNVGFNFSQAYLQNFTSEEFQSSADPLVSSTKLGLDSFVPFLNNTPIAFAATQQKKTSGTENNSLTSKVSAYFNGVALSNRLTNTTAAGVNLTTGELQISTRPKNINLRGSLTYNVGTAIESTSLNLNANEILKQGLNLTQSVTNQFQNNDTRFEVGLNKMIGEYGLGLNMGASNHSDYFLTLSLNFSAAIQPRSLSLFTSAQPMNSTGAASIRTFIDHNMNGVMDASDTPLEGVSFRVNGGLNPNKTDQNGLALITHLPTGQRVNIAVDRNSIEDPQQTPVRKGVRLLPRPGKIAELDFSFIETTEIDGVISLGSQERIHPASNLNLELVAFDNPEIIISHATTAFDGYYVMSEVPPGNYILRVEPMQAQSLNILKVELCPIRILPNSNFINGFNFTAWVGQSEELKFDRNLLPLRSVNEDATISVLNYIVLAADSKSASYQLTIDKLQALHITPLKRRLGSVTELAIGGFKYSSNAKKLEDHLKRFGFAETSIQKAKKIQWSKSKLD